MPGDFRVSITNAPGAGSYPISSFTWLLIPTHFADPAKGKAVADFLHWMLEHGEGEGLLDWDTLRCLSRWRIRWGRRLGW